MAQFLILKSTNDILQSQLDFYINFIESLANNVYLFDLNSISLEEAINENTSPLVYSYIIVLGHGNDEIFSDNNNIEYTWLELATSIRNSDNFDENSTLILKTCDGGNKEVANTIFRNCSKIKFIFGASGIKENFDLFFNSILFLYYIFWKEKGAIKSTELVNRATDFNMVCFDRDDGSFY